MKKQKTTEKIFIDKNSLYKLSFIIITFFLKNCKSIPKSSKKLKNQFLSTPIFVFYCATYKLQNYCNTY